MKNIKNYNLFVSESVNSNYVKDFLNDFGFLLTLNFSKISSYSIDDNAKRELNELLKNIRKPMINGKTYTELLNDVNNIIQNPKYLSVLLTQIKGLLEYIEPRIKKFVIDGNIKTNWLEKIDKLKTQYIQIIS